MVGFGILGISGPSHDLFDGDPTESHIRYRHEGNDWFLTVYIPLLESRVETVTGQQGISVMAPVLRFR